MRYVGWDWASRTHDVTVLDEQGGVLERWAFPHTEAGWITTLHRLRRHGEPDDLPVIIEKSSGVVVDRLLGARHPVVPVHPTSFAARPRWGPPARTTPRTRSPAEWPRYRCWVAGRGPRRGRWLWTPAGPAGRGYTAGPAGGEVLGMLALAMHGRGWWTT